MKFGRLIVGSSLLLLVVAVLFLQPGRSMPDLAGGRSFAGAAPAAKEVPSGQVIVSDPVVPVLVGPVSDLPPYFLEPGLDREINPRQQPYGDKVEDFIFEGGPDPLLALQEAAPAASDEGFETPIFNFDGAGYTNVNPPDTNGAVGKDHYIQMINGSVSTVVSVYNKNTGALIQRFNLSTLGGCSTGIGDPIVLYDHLADRWLLSEFGPGNSLCVFISQTPDPTGAYYSYQFPTPSFPDYPKYGVWPDGYYASTNESSPAAYALNRTAMLAGAPATSQRFTAPGLSGFGFEALTPSDWDGMTPPPAGAPNPFMRHRDTEAHGPAGFPAEDFLEVWAFHVDWTTPANSTFTQVANVSTAEFDSNICGLTAFNGIAMPGVAKCANNSLDPIREVVMFKLQYRNFGSHEVLVGNLVTDASGADDTGVRWYELRKSGGGGWTLHQEGTYAPDSHSRWMGAIAMDGGGNIAMGYNVSSGTLHPSLRYAGRLAGDPLGTMPQSEYTLITGAGTNGSNRYGDYSGISVDPIDDCTFWFTGEYNATSQWSTRIGAFRFDACGSAGFAMSTTPGSQDICVGSPAGYTVSTIETGNFSGNVSLAAVGNPGTATFVPNPIPVPASSALTISGAAAGSYTFEVVGTSVVTPTLVNTNTVDLNVIGSPPAAPNLVSPANGAANVPVQPTFTWTGDADSYTIEIASDSAFNNVVESATVGGTNYTMTGTLSILSSYFWRVTPSNVCGTGATSQVYLFSTGAVFCSAPNLPIPDNNPAGASDTFSAGSTGFAISDLNVSLDASHTWVGDLIFSLEHDDTGTTVTLMDRPGVPASTFGCSNDNIDAEFDDEGADGPVESMCGTNPAIFGSPVPQQPLSAFDGESLDGSWTLTVSDSAGGDTGTVNEWCLVPTVETGTLEGTVTDADSAAPVAGALVEAVGGFSLATLTDATGYYSMTVPAGSYTMTASADGYIPSTVSGVAVAAGTTTTQDFALSPEDNTIYLPMVFLPPVSATAPAATAGLLLLPAAALGLWSLKRRR